MAVCAPDHAFVDLGFDPRPGQSALNELTHVGAFVSQMVEVEKQGVRLATIDASYAKCLHLRASPLPRLASTLRRVGDVPLLIAPVPRFGIGPLTRKADPLARLFGKGSKGKVRQRFRLGAHATDTSFVGRSEEQLGG